MAEDPAQLMTAEDDDLNAQDVPWPALPQDPSCASCQAGSRAPDARLSRMIRILALGLLLGSAGALLATVGPTLAQTDGTPPPAAPEGASASCPPAVAAS